MRYCTTVLGILHAKKPLGRVAERLRTDNQKLPFAPGMEITNPTHKLGEIADVRAGYLTRKAVRNEPEGTHCLLQIRDFSRDRTAVNVANMVRITPEPRSSVSSLQPGDVVFLAKGANNFAVAISDMPAPTLAASYFFILRPKPMVLSGYLAWFLNHESTRALLSRLATTGAHMPIIRRDVLESIEIPLPPITAQKTIAALDSLRLQEQTLLADLARKQQELVSGVCMTTARNAIGTTTSEGTTP